KTNDNRILAIAKNLSLEEERKENGRPVILVSKDALVRVKADALGLMAEDFLYDRVINVDEMYTGFQEMYVTNEQLAHFYKEGKIEIESVSNMLLYPNQYVIMKNPENPSSSALGIVDSISGMIKKLNPMQDQVWGIKPRNVQQLMAFDLLLRQD